MTSPETTFLIILLHGVGSNGADLAPLGRIWASTVPDAIFVAPDAPQRSSFGTGYQWFSVAGVTEDNRPGRIAAARPAFDAVLQDIIDKNGFSGQLDRVVLVGFSQGTMMALDAVASGRWPVAGVVGFSGRLASPEPLTPASSMRLLLIHGSVDPVILPIETTRAATRLEQFGFDVRAYIEPGVAHTISARGIGRAATFLADIARR